MNERTGIMLSRRHFTTGLAAATSLPLATGRALSQAWPARPITLVVPFGAGTASDTLARPLAEFLGRELGQSVVVENRAGAGGNIGAASVARSAGDGYTFLLATTGQAATNKLMYQNLSYDSDKDLAPVILVGKLPVVIAAKKGGKFASLKALLDAAKANPGTINVGFPGNGTLGHITGLLFAKKAGVTFNQVQYTGSTKIVGDLLGGHIDAAMDSIGGYLSNISGGDIAALAIASSKQFAPLPDRPTVAEAGMAGFEASVWYALLAPKDVPSDIVGRVNGAVAKYLASTDGKALYNRLGVEAGGGTPADLKAFIAAEQAKWGPVIAENNIKF